MGTSKLMLMQSRPMIRFALLRIAIVTDFIKPLLFLARVKYGLLTLSDFILCNERNAKSVMGEPTWRLVLCPLAM